MKTPPAGRCSRSPLSGERTFSSGLLGVFGPRKLLLERLEARDLLSAGVTGSGQEPSLWLSGFDSAEVEDAAPATDFFADVWNDTLSGAAEPAQPKPASGAEEPLEADGDLAPYPLEETFFLHSSPGSLKTIHLDFDGHTTSGTVWNTKYTGGNSFTTEPYSFEGDSSFSDAELERIQRIWERVAEDFIPFDVNVTTEDPGEAALKKFGWRDEEWGIRVVIGGDNDDWYLGSGGGIAYVDSFDWSTDTPCFIFAKELGNGRENYTAEASSHEVGHTLGLEHDGTIPPPGTPADQLPNYEYYTGHGSGTTGWAPIMGAGYYKTVVQWSRGEYDEASNTEDDLAIITTHNGFGYRPDDHGSSMASAGALRDGFGTTVVSAAGIIERNTDLDYFSFSINVSGTLQLDVDPFHRSPNLDVLAKLYDSGGSVIASSNPTTALDASFSLDLSAGDYYLSVEGTGKGTPSDGYSDYGSLGQYTITGTIRDKVSWDGGPAGTGTLWHVPENWLGDALPGPDDDVVIGAAFAGTTISVTGDVAVNSLTGEAAISISSTTFSIADDTVVGHALTLHDATLTIGGTLTNAAGNTLTLIGSTINADVVNEGILLAMYAGDQSVESTNRIEGSFLNGQAATLRVLPVNTNTSVSAVTTVTVEFSQGIVNHGTIELNQSAVAGSGHAVVRVADTLVNEPTGQIVVLPGSGNVPGSRALEAELNNRGTLRVLQGLSVSKTDALHSNSGTIEVADGQTLTVDGGTQGFNNTGVLRVGNGATIDLRGTLRIDEAGILDSQPLGEIRVGGDLVGNGTNAAQFASGGAVQLGTADGPASFQLLEVMGEDLGNVEEGFSGNFAHGSLRLENTSVELVDFEDNSSGLAPEALYLDTLIVPAGTTLVLNGLNVYARTAQIEGTVVGTVQVIGVPLAEVVGRHIFYNHSSFDGNDPAPGATDDQAVAADKAALRSGAVASFANYTSYSRGINGIMVDVGGLSADYTPTAADFQFLVGNSEEAGDWLPAPDPATVDLRRGAGVGGSDRITITWNDHAIRNEWLEVTVLAAGTGLVGDDVFYFGNAVAEAGNLASNTQVTTIDLLLARNNPRTLLNPAGIDFPYDFNRDQRVNATDVLLARNNQTSFGNALKLFDLSSPPEGGTPSPAQESSLPADWPVGLDWLYNFDGDDGQRHPAEETRVAPEAADELLDAWV